MSNTDPTHPCVCVQVCPPRFHLDIWKINENNTSLWFLRRCPSYASQKVSCSTRSDNELRRRIQLFHKCALMHLLCLNIDFMILTIFLPYEIEILTYRQGFGDPHWSGYFQIVEMIQWRIGHQNSEDKRHANPNHFRSPKVDQPWWTNWKWENLMIAWAWSATTLCQSQVFCIFSAFSLGYFREAVYLSP